jgi:hypothetical protein
LNSFNYQKSRKKSQIFGGFLTPAYSALVALIGAVDEAVDNGGLGG